MRLNVSLLDDLEAHGDELNILKAAAEFPKQQKPLMLVCGSEDLTTPLKETQAIAEAASGPLTEMQIIPGAGHTFGAEHPFKGMTEPLNEVIEISKAFFKKHLIL
jgi:pimeloyl-ACP methyl ester carboxylesterase